MAETIEQTGYEVAPFHPTQKLTAREKILRMHNIVWNSDGALYGDAFPLEHSFAEKTYVREIRVPADMLVVTKIIKESHPVFLMQGECLVFDEHKGARRVTAPSYFISDGGVKRIVYTLSDVVWVTVHHNGDNETDLILLEEKIIAPSYEDYDQFFLSVHSKIEKLEGK